ncbi:MAG: RNA polymerase sigma factor [Chlorobi bacterium CHB2]|nr:RNA polymerase sigma factor [Chlorobi bacterium CHB2]
MEKKPTNTDETMSQLAIAIPSPANARAERTAPAVGRDALLLSRHLEGDDAAFVELFNRHNNRLFAYCLKMVGRSETAEDLTQELWEKVIRLRQQPKKIDNPIGFFLTMARNLSLNHLKASARTSRFEDLPESAHPAVDDLRERSEMEEIVVAALAALPMDYREVLILNMYSGYGLDEIAVMLGKSSQAIWKRASRAREKLRAEVMKRMEKSR